LTKGTEEYEKAVLKANEATIKLLETYKDLDYTVNDEGLIIINEFSLEEAKKTQQEILKNAQMANLSAQ
jgi:hypothetical protein